MIINSGNRTDIPAFYSDWFYNRIEAGVVYVRNPYFRRQITSYRLCPSLVDCLAFCTKNPRPMLSRLDRLDRFRQFWFVTLTPYGADVEPGVPSGEEVIESFRELSVRVGSKRVQWRYDPILLTEKYHREFHLDAFDKLAAALEGYTDTCVISFIDLYEKTKRNFPGIREVGWEDQVFLAKEMAARGKRYGMRIVGCAESRELGRFGVDTGGCMTKEVLERALELDLHPRGHRQKRESCPCLLGIDVGEYNSCGHGCLYCYANQNDRAVRRTMPLHDPRSPLLIGWPEEGEEVKEAVQVTYLTGQGRLF
ncbi:MAG: DUF1848 domain-containing protein [Spirochaetales bacterium]|nr:DUF1848 domain-containing protein [Spirochaetales bacterium]